MTDVSLTAAHIRPLNGAILRHYAAGGALVVGNAGYIASDGDVEKADANVSAATGRGIGVVVESYDGETAIVAGDPCTLCVFGPVSGFSGLTPGANYYVSDTAGAIADAAGTQSRIIGYAESTTVLFVHPEMNDPSSA
jgi:hypothetical protein